MNNEKKATVIGVITAALGIFALVAFIALALSVILFFRSCTKVEPNSGKEPYTSDYIAGWLADSYGTGFTFVRELETPEYSDETAYVYSDADGIGFTVVQWINHGYMFNSHYEVTDYYLPAKMFADNDVLAKLGDSGFSYSFTPADGVRSAYVCEICVSRAADIEPAADVLYSIADYYIIPEFKNEKKYGAEFDSFSHMSPCFVLVDSSGSRFSDFVNIPTTPEGQFPYILKSKPDFISEAKKNYTSRSAAPKEE